MVSIHKVLVFPFSLRAIFSRRNREQPKRQRSEQPQASFAQPKESRRFRLERECSNYRSIHFPR